jgi:hypothetical protein
VAGLTAVVGSGAVIILPSHFRPPPGDRWRTNAYDGSHLTPFRAGAGQLVLSH